MGSVQSKLLTPFTDLLHGFSTKEGGHSQADFHGNNLAFHVNDDTDTVKRNHLFFSNELGYPLERLIHMDQIHGDTIVIIDKDTDFKQTPQCDAVITSLKNTPLMVMVADCIPILIYDPVNKVIAAVHAGRAGVFTQILPKTIKTFQETYQSSAKDLLIVLGPSIQECCYEVGEDIKHKAIEEGYDYAIKIKEHRYYLSLKDITRQQLRDAGVKNHHIEYSPYCTSCNNELFYSYRAEKNICGRFCGLIMLK